MADGEITISELELSEELLADMVIPVETSTDTKSATLAQLRSWLGTSLPIGSIFASVGKIDDARFTLLDGKTLSATGTYAEFYLKAVEKVQAGKWQSCTEEEFNQDISNYGQCGKFVISNDYVRIPKLTRFIGATNNIAEVGSTYGESLPNIEFSAEIVARSGTGALTTGNNTGSYVGPSSSNNLYEKRTDFNASSSSSTYKDNAKVQPDHTKYFYYMVISTEGQTEPVDIDINQVYEDMELKANKSFSNIDNEGKSLASGWGMPSSRYIDLTLGASGSTYTAPANGYVYIDKVGNADQYITIHNINNYITDRNYSRSANNHIFCCVACQKNDRFEIQYNASGATNRFIFVYAEGEN